MPMYHVFRAAKETQQVVDVLSTEERMPSFLGVRVGYLDKHIVELRDTRGGSHFIDNYVSYVRVVPTEAADHLEFIKALTASTSGPDGDLKEVTDNA